MDDVSDSDVPIKKKRNIRISDSDSSSSTSASDTSDTYQDPHPNGGQVNSMNLWNAVPRRYRSKYANISATHASDEDIQDRGSASSDTDRELTPGFVSDQDDAIEGTVNAADMAYMASMLPLTAQRTREVRVGRRK